MKKTVYILKSKYTGEYVSTFDFDTPFGKTIGWTDNPLLAKKWEFSTVALVVTIVEGIKNYVTIEPFEYEETHEKTA